MTWPSHICSRWGRLTACLAMAVLLLPAHAAAATVSGSIRLMDSRDPNVSRRGDYSGVVIWLERLGGDPLPVVRPRTVKIVQKQKTFIPHIVAVPVGATVEFPNDDPIFHKPFFYFSREGFD